MIFFFLGSGLLNLAAGLSIAPRNGLVLHESVPKIPAEWKHHSVAKEHETVLLTIALSKPPSQEIVNIAENVSDPEHASYGKYLSAEDLQALRNDNHAESCQLIEKWLQSHGINHLECEDGYARFATDVAKANRALDASFANYHIEGQEPVLRTTRYSLPSDLTRHIDFIYPTVHFLSGHKNKIRPEHTLEARQHGIPPGGYNCGNSICPKNVTERYNINYYPKDGCSGSKIGVTGFIGNFPNKTDVRQFLKFAGLKAQKAVPDYKLQVINNGTTKISKTNPALTVEPILDLDYTLAFTGPIPATFYTTGGMGPFLKQPGNVNDPKDSPNEPYLEFFEALLKEKSPPQVISISYSDDEQSIPIKYAQKVCNLMAQAAARGITIVGSSGDGGAQGTSSSDCKGPDGKYRYIPTFPSGCPWMTSIGAVASYGGPASYSSGGFSNYFPVPKWQSAATKQYIRELNGTGKGLYNASGRGIPDVSLLGDGFLIQDSGFNLSQKGTSASAPVFAAMVTLLNDIRLREGKPVLGHVNPLLYSAKIQSSLKDVVDEFGSSNGCSDGDFNAPGWSALKGWDAATGLGEPDFRKLRALLT